MTNERILAVCRSNWEYRGIDDASVRDMLDELSAHLDDASAAGRTTRDVVGDDVGAFAASWARARAPFPRRALRMASMACFIVGWLALFGCLLRWTTELAVGADDLTFCVALIVVSVAWELRRGTLSLGRSLATGLAATLCAALLTGWLSTGGALFTLPLWAAAAMLLPGVPYAVADTRARKATATP
ncbi:hypothetical protein ABVG11_01540 [Streptomyces sp. HD1123-B1]|uniref:hypothetical protein n=1 Tax=Streptomyces huangiella TaxID=3228804 RepID=UPI003D7CAFF1